MHDSSNTIISSARRFFSGTAISRTAGLAREIAMAAAFGTTPAVAAFWMAFRFAHLTRRLFGEGALNAAFVPHFEALRKEEPKLAARFFFDLSIGMTLLLLFLACASEAVLGGFLLFFKMSASAQEVVKLTMLMLPALVFISLYALNTSFLNCEKSYFLPSVAPSFLNAVWVIAVCYLWFFGVQEAMEKLAMILVFAFALQWLVTMPQVFRYLKRELKETWKEEKGFSGKEIAALVRPFLLGLIGVAATQVNSALDALFARAADPEGPAYLWYAIRIQQLPLALFGLGLTGALLPPISRAIQGGDRVQYLFFLNFALRRVAVLMIPMTIGLFIGGFSGVNLIYGHGEFSHEGILKTTSCLFAYGAGLVPMTAVLILASAFYAQKEYKIPALTSAGCVSLNIALNALFVFGLNMGAISVAVSTSIVACVNSLVLIFFLKRKAGLSLSGSGRPLFKVGIGSAAAALLTIFVSNRAFSDNTWLFLLGQHLVSFPKSLRHQLEVFLFNGACFSTLFLGFAYLLRVKDIFDLIAIRVRSQTLK